MKLPSSLPGDGDKSPAPSSSHDSFTVIDEEKDRNFITALARGIEVLRCFGPGANVLGNQELAARTGLPKPTISRLTYTLSKLGCLKAVPHSSKYQLDFGVLALGFGLLSIYRSGPLHTR
jgi:hypothetical protein